MVDGVTIMVPVGVSHLGEVPVVQADDDDAPITEPPGQQRTPCLVPNRPRPARDEDDDGMPRPVGVPHHWLVQVELLPGA